MILEIQIRLLAQGGDRYLSAIRCNGSSPEGIAGGPYINESSYRYAQVDVGRLIEIDAQLRKTALAMCDEDYRGTVSTPRVESSSLNEQRASKRVPSESLTLGQPSGIEVSGADTDTM